jgi:hypothetical protein
MTLSIVHMCRLVIYVIPNIDLAGFSRNLYEFYKRQSKNMLIPVPAECA